ncbi:hypothetical protein CRUP_013054 [Coryphaenoides rupestris]|nr:hypothetical protein CRUP_013054 [Coryphaenoides rupestris]
MGGAWDHGGGKGSYAETAWMFKLRRELDQLDSIHHQTEHGVVKAREHLKLCRQNIADMAKLREKLEQEMEQTSEPGSR